MGNLSAYPWTMKQLLLGQCCEGIEWKILESGMGLHPTLGKSADP